MNAVVSDSALAAARYNIYANIHKALRAAMSEALVGVGRLDADDDIQVAAVLEQVRALHSFLAVHLDHENRFLHTAMEARQPGSSGDTAREHAEHECALRSLQRAVEAVANSPAPARAAAVLQLYRQLALLVAENIEHMNLEETQNHAVLCANYTDAEVRAIEVALVAALSPESAAMSLRWMIPAVNHAERVALFHGIQESAPTPVFEGALAIAKSYLSGRDWDKLNHALALPHSSAA